MSWAQQQGLRGVRAQQGAREGVRSFEGEEAAGIRAGDLIAKLIEQAKGGGDLHNNAVAAPDVLFQLAGTLLPRNPHLLRQGPPPLVDLLPATSPSPFRSTTTTS